MSASGLVRWSNGELFDGYLMIGIAPPVGLADNKVQYFGSLSKQQLPQWCRIAIISGVIDNVSRVFQNASIDPPNSRYAIYWTDRAFNVLYTPVALVTIATDPYQITVPTLTAPTAPTIIPPLET